MERTIERTEILLPSNPASKQAASAVHFTNGDFRIEWFHNIGAALENLLAQVGSICRRARRLRRDPMPPTPPCAGVTVPWNCR